jgi:anti-anti-sigma regulatory factor
MRTKEQAVSTVFPIHSADTLVYDAIASAAAKNAAPPTIDITLERPGIAIITLRGEHDISNARHLTEALECASQHASVLVDLSACTWIDLTIIGRLIVAHNRQTARGGRLELIIPADAQPLQHIAKRTGLSKSLPINSSRGAAMGNLGAPESECEARPRHRHGLWSLVDGQRLRRNRAGRDEPTHGAAR